MGNVNVAGHLSRRQIVKDLQGNIITMLDETNGGYIIRNRQVVNPERYQEILKAQQDKMEAAKAITMQKVDPNAPDRNVTAKEAVTNQNKMVELENKVIGMENKLDAILKALNEKK